MEKFKWNGHATLCGKSQQKFQEVSEVLVHFLSKKRKAIELYRELSHEICNIFCVPKNELRKKGRTNNLSKAKYIISYIANHEMGVSWEEISKFFNASGGAISKNIR